LFEQNQLDLDDPKLHYPFLQCKRVIYKREI
jgi:hypothetical protein